MVKLIALYRKPADPAAFDKHYREIHMPLAAKIPGLVKMDVAKVFGSPGGDPEFYQVAELFFENKAAMFSGLQSPEGAAAAKDVKNFAGEIIHMMFASVE
ncbi:MAG TPA: EthD family reductase [Phycisphaerae bacterium]